MDHRRSPEGPRLARRRPDRAVDLRPGKHTLCYYSLPASPLDLRVEHGITNTIHHRTAKMSNPVVHVYTVCWNEEKILPFFFRHYGTFASRIFVYDNNSTDGTSDIIDACDIAERISFDTKDRHDNRRLIDIKNNAYKRSRGTADYVVVVDADEFLFHPDILSVIAEGKRNGATLFRTIGYNMTAWRFPKGSAPLVAQVHRGVPSSIYAKTCIFDPRLSINYDLGAHSCQPDGHDVEYYQGEELLLLHYHYVGVAKTIARHKACRSRLPEKPVGKVSEQFYWGPLEIFMRFVYYSGKAVDVFTGKRSVFWRGSAKILDCGKKISGGISRTLRASSVP